MSPTFDTIGDVCDLFMAPDADDVDEQVDDDDDELVACSNQEKKNKEANHNTSQFYLSIFT